ncbi:hypothetical protein BJ138DRAFT_1109370 [Hygrophoropsis aurantiaca]|uniref:Uncharacterized protein n=1 Tax=Hygrophoropsis aurantiaca TaxID=72124 RepID=A0ACB8AR44_9AGAM|nr:hypothetical protein BJ138DRAFT_1109370 [Hygrophoropsis aurantiaca]
MGNQAGDQDPSATIKIIDDEVLELKKQEGDLLARLHLLQDTIARKQARSGQLTNSRIPVYRLPNEILLACFNQAVQFWLTESAETDERITADCLCVGYRPVKPRVFPCTHTPAIAISHVSHKWRQITVNMPSLWTKLAIAPRLERQLNIPQLRDYIDRAKSMPVTLTFRNLRWIGTLSSTQLSAIIPLVQQRQITGLTFLDSVTILWHILRRGGERFLDPLPSVFGHLTALNIFEVSGTFGPSGLKSLLFAMPQLKNLGLGFSCRRHHYDYADRLDEDEPTIHLPVLDTMTITDWSIQMRGFLRSVSAPALRQFKLMCWCQGDETCLFINDVPRFPDVRHLVFSSYYRFDREFIRAFEGVTHLTVLKFDEMSGYEDPEPVFWPNLQHLTLEFAFAPRLLDIKWLQASEDRPEHPLQISVFDSSKVINERILFQRYKMLQRYGNLEGTRMDEFRRWQADGEPELA